MKLDLPFAECMSSFVVSVWEDCLQNGPHGHHIFSSPQTRTVQVAACSECLGVIHRMGLQRDVVEVYWIVTMG